MTVTIADVRDGLARVLETIDGWRAGPYLGDQVNPPCFKIARPAFDPRMVFGGSKASHTFRVHAYASRGATDTHERLLDELCELSGTGSVIAAVQDGTNWPVTVDYAQVTQVGEVGISEIAGVEYLVVNFDIEVVW